jgi:hypothetical protein
MKRIFYTLFSLFAAVSIVLLRCSGTNVAGGGTIETTNGIVGLVRNSDDTPAANSIVKLFPDDYDPVAGDALGVDFIDTADAKGTYRFSRIASGSYTVLARDQEALTSFLKRDITVDDDSITTVPAGTLNITGSIVADFSSSGVAAGVYVYIPGTDISSSIGSDGSALLADVPPGTLTVVMLASDDNEIRNVLRDEITVEPGDTVTVPLPLWKYTRRLVLNTTASGAGVAGDIYNFPLLIRLNGGNFDFTQARTDGRDLAFTGSGNTPLPFEIERWDATAQCAEIWVRVDTIFGNDSMQWITMYWGNPDASSLSASGAVFDTSVGFQGVWHLGEAVGGQIYDATVNQYDGASPDTARPQIVDGVVGNCRQFDGVTDYITMPNTADGKLNFPVDGYYTVSAWVFLDTLDGATHLIVAKGYEQYFLRFTYFPSNSPLLEFSEFSETDTWQACTTTATSRRWMLLTGVSQGSRQLLYCDGVLVDSTPNIYPTDSYSRNTSNDLSIGKFLKVVNVPNFDDDSYCFFKGSIDEVRILNTAKSPEWVRLCYMNQRVDDRLVVFR